MITKNKHLSILFIALLGCLAMSTTSMAQRTPGRAGVKGGLNVSNLYNNEINDKDARLGFNAGLYGQLFSSDVFAIQPELLYSTKGSMAVYDGVVNQEVKYNLNYLDLPVLAVFKLGKQVELHAGGYASYLLNANISYEGDLGNGADDIDKDHLKSYDYGLIGGIGFNFGNIQLGARYNYGLVKLADSDASEILIDDSKNSVGQVYLAVNLNK